MLKRLTLRMDEALIQRAKRHAKSRGKTLSRMVADYFALLDDAPPDSEPLPPLTRSLTGLLRDSALSKEDYAEHLLRKHLETKA